MIKRFTDHSANERTYLAWIRTAITIMAFGFLIEKFDLFIAYIGQATGHPEQFQPSIAAEIVGIGLFLVGIITIIGATIRFFINKQSIESEEEVVYSVRRSNLILSGLMILLALFLMLYMIHQLWA